MKTTAIGPSAGRHGGQADQAVRAPRGVGVHGGIRGRWSAAALVVAAIVIGGCGGTRNFENENDRLRAVNLELEQKLQKLQSQLELRTDELAAMRQQVSAGHAVEGAEPPQIARINFDRYTGAVDTDGDGVDDVVRVYVHPVDGQGRFLPVSGEATVRLVSIAATDSPRVLTERSYAPSQWNDAYRSGFMGTHYTLELELPESMPKELTQGTLHVTLVEGQTGTTLTQQQVVELTLSK